MDIASAAGITRAGTIHLRIPKLRKGSYFPSLLEPRQAERAVPVQEPQVQGASTRKVDALVRSRGWRGSQEAGYPGSVLSRMKRRSGPPTVSSGRSRPRHVREGGPQSGGAITRGRARRARLRGVYTWPRIHSTNPWSVCCGRRCDVVGIFPSPRAALRLIGAVLVEQRDEREAGRRYFSLASMAAPYGAQGEQENPVEAVEEVLTG